MVKNSDNNKDAFNAIIDNSLMRLDNIDSLTEYEKFLEISFIAFKFRFHALSGNYFSSIATLIGYKSKIKEILHLKTKRRTLLIQGLYNTCMSYGRKNKFYVRALLWFMPDAQKDLGIKQLLKSSKLSGITNKTGINILLIQNIQ